MKNASIETLEKNMKVWCWWKSRNLYFTGRIIKGGEYEFVDEIGAITMLQREEVSKLQIK